MVQTSRRLVARNVFNLRHAPSLALAELAARSGLDCSCRLDRAGTTQCLDRKHRSAGRGARRGGEGSVCGPLQPVTTPNSAAPHSGNEQLAQADNCRVNPFIRNHLNPETLPTPVALLARKSETRALQTLMAHTMSQSALKLGFRAHRPGGKRKSSGRKAAHYLFFSDVLATRSGLGD